MVFAMTVSLFMGTDLAYGASPTALGRASVVIAVVSGISSTSNLEVMYPSSSGTLTDTEKPGRSEKSSIQSAQFSVSGVPFQAFSVALSESTLTETPQGTVVLTKFMHNAGAVPMTGSNGKGGFSVIGQAKRAAGSDSFVAVPSGHRLKVTVTYN